MKCGLKIEMDKKLKRKINKTEKEINLSRMKIYPARPVKFMEMRAKRI